MCENDQAVDAWFAALHRRAVSKSHKDAIPGISVVADQMAIKSGYQAGTLRELAATVPGVREWLIAHMPEGE